jgi:hypothetical protein
MMLVVASEAVASTGGHFMFVTVPPLSNGEVESGRFSLIVTVVPVAISPAYNSHTDFSPDLMMRGRGRGRGHTRNWFSRQLDGWRQLEMIGHGEDVVVLAPSVMM